MRTALPELQAQPQFGVPALAVTFSREAAVFEASWSHPMDRFKRTATFLASSVVEKGTDPFCRNGPQGAAHKRGLSPFPFRVLLR